jgi:simple sugar transport system permease protein
MLMIRIGKRADMPMWKATTIRLTSIVAALGTLAFFVAFMGHEPMEVYASMLDGSFGTVYRIQETIKVAIPLTITALGMLLAFKMQFWNIGGDGQMILGAVLGSFIALKFTTLPMPVMLLLMTVAGVLGGGLWALIPSVFKTRFGTNETLFTLMMNYVALKIVIFLQYGPWRDPNALGFPKIPNFVDAALFPKLFGVHVGWLIAILLVVAVTMILNRSSLGYEIAVIGNSERTAKYAGMNVSRVTMLTIFTSGALCGLAGILQASAVAGTLTYEVSGGYGYTAIIIAWLSGMNPIAVPFTATLFAVLTQGANFIQTSFGIPAAAAKILQAMILIFALGSEFFIQYELYIKWPWAGKQSAEGGK